MNDALTKDLRNGMGLEDALIKHKTNLKEVMKAKTSRKTGEKYIHRVSTGWVIKKYIRGTVIQFGVYYSLIDAKLVRDELIKCNWDKTQLARIIQENDVLRDVPIDEYGNKYIQKTKYGKFRVTKKFGSGKNTVSVYGGTYNNIKVARVIRNELIKCNWNTECLPEIKKRYGIVNNQGE